ncbi:unnamed protein product [Lactuca virosa]|uniref:Uncharacterized protein n=1 Tax=Lactuca virosa TaxID=75947 RepID=A0AAU9MUC2_9ASTR|nr:unnamed protein product [Lactuca virosa]
MSAFIFCPTSDVGCQTCNLNFFSQLHRCGMPTVKHGNLIAFIRIEIARNMKSSTAFFSKLWTHLLRRHNNFDSPSIQSRKLGHLRFQLKVSVQFQVFEMNQPKKPREKTRKKASKTVLVPSTFIMQ